MTQVIRNPDHPASPISVGQRPSGTVIISQSSSFIRVGRKEIRQLIEILQDIR
jgi:hypothetical protein